MSSHHAAAAKHRGAKSEAYSRSHNGFNRIFNDVNICDAFNWSRSAIRAITAEAQYPLLDDNGSGGSDWQDGALALTTYIGAAFVTGADLPSISDYAKNIVLSSNTETLWASGVWAADGMKEVFAYIVNPSTSSNTKVTLAYNSTNGRYEYT